jgi:hypothetical protein
MGTFTDAQRAEVAFGNATERAQQATRDIFNQFGMTRFNQNTGWSTSNSASAFDPTQIVSFSGGVAQINQGALDQAASGRFGTAMGYNRLGSVMNQSAENEYNATANVRNRGLGAGKGGLVNQARAAAESQQGRAQAGVGQELLAALGQQYGNYGGAYDDKETARLGYLASSASTNSDNQANSTAKSPATGTAGKPTAPGTKMYQRVNGFQWLGKTKGWVKV